ARVEHRHARAIECAPQQCTRERRPTLIRRADDQNRRRGSVLALHALSVPGISQTRPRVLLRRRLATTSTRPTSTAAAPTSTKGFVSFEPVRGSAWVCAAFAASTATSAGPTHVVAG